MDLLLWKTEDAFTNVSDCWITGSQALTCDSPNLVTRSRLFLAAFLCKVRVRYLLRPSYSHDVSVSFLFECEYDTIRYDSVYLTCSKKLTGSQLSLPHGINKKLKCETKNKMVSVIGPVSFFNDTSISRHQIHRLQ